MKVSFSYKYLDQGLLPTLEKFGVYVECELKFRGWPPWASRAEFKIHSIPLAIGQSLKVSARPTEQGSLKEVFRFQYSRQSRTLLKLFSCKYDATLPQMSVNTVLRENTHRIKAKDKTPEDISAISTDGLM
ncbi:ffedbfb5-37cf-4a1f-8a90-4ad533b733f8 [Sclerotinia trifoliorum]|uniref:Ffedbfb5-37cf-4a1f-8a90-4ad533b733f8 n=1 Tax=Sclerotinia trifoliorum TaxID=28548 RepID=A0A8H2VSK1_9HELO|nr:ffedbfb5-37cf-4a1f-8a90-4ad533b733f8 [Sclerotinia trifoliorum]